MIILYFNDKQSTPIIFYQHIGTIELIVCIRLVRFAFQKPDYTQVFSQQRGEKTF